MGIVSWESRCFICLGCKAAVVWLAFDVVFSRCVLKPVLNYGAVVLQPCALTSGGLMHCEWESPWACVFLFNNVCTELNFVLVFFPLSTSSTIWAGQCRWPGLEMAQGWVVSTHCPRRAFENVNSLTYHLKSEMRPRSWSISSPAGHPGLDYISGAHLSIKNWSVQTLQKVCPFLLLIYKLEFTRHFLMRTFVWQWGLRQVVWRRD